jgi:toxin ParE1/3/4
MWYVIWTHKARADLREIRNYIAIDNPEAASRLADGIVGAAESLGDFPHKGRMIRRGLRHIHAVHPYIIRYRVKGDLIEITRVYHGARNVRSPRLDYSAQPAIA